MILMHIKIWEAALQVYQCLDISIDRNAKHSAFGQIWLLKEFELNFVFQ